MITFKENPLEFLVEQNVKVTSNEQKVTSKSNEQRGKNNKQKAETKEQTRNKQKASPRFSGALIFWKNEKGFAGVNFATDCCNYKLCTTTCCTSGRA